MNEPIEERALVIGLEGTQVHLEIERNQACGLCGKTRGCGVSIVGKALGHHGTIKVENTLHANVGQYVLLKIQSNHLLKGTAVLYGVPLIGLLLGALVGRFVFHAISSVEMSKDGLEIIGAMIGFFLSQYWVKHYSQASHHASHFAPQLIKIIDPTVINISCERSH